jgi:hypothetical protein
LKITIGVGLCDGENTDTCLAYVEILRNAVFKLPKENLDGSISIEPG